MITHNIEDLQTLAIKEYGDDWPWMVVGVFPTDPDDLHSWFNYTVGLGAAELWCSCYSIEGRGMDNALTGAILNVLAGAWTLGYLAYGDNVSVPLGIPGPDGEWLRDAEAVYWVATSKVPSEMKQVHLPGAAEWTVPVLWSSPLGWPE